MDTNPIYFDFSLIIIDKSINSKEIIDYLTKNNIDSRPIVYSRFYQKLGFEVF